MPLHPAAGRPLGQGRGAGGDHPVHGHRRHRDDRGDRVPCRREPERIAVGNGSTAPIRDLAATLAGPGDEVLLAAPSFPYYRNATIIAGATAVPVPLTGHRHDLRAMAAAVTDRTRVIFVCNPNNPTGTIVDAGDLARFVARVPHHIAVVIDEAHIELAAPGTASPALARSHGTVVILRTFSQAHGLAAGWLPDRTGGTRRVRPPDRRPLRRQLSGPGRRAPRSVPPPTSSSSPRAGAPPPSSPTPQQPRS
ncbi:aminotransferase class I/II-fold pyridoxal phosphate-dependent enzyme [Specibacter cremeus]|uniref:aminotransferase class I/II-fold pyridoxal phosphate-dependent enzyme n=1 Tax=Specibacter cremeus TaxID=1629051 RepID=UPI000F766CC5